MELILAIVTVAAAITITVFIALFSTVRWERTGVGISLMAVSLATALIAWMSVARRWDEMHGNVDWATEIQPALILAWIIVGAVFAWRIREFLKGRGDDD
ncbi:hypothetical protein [Dermacoccus sp. GAS27A]|uniref:putative phage holin n=1 Tax=Dermacoccus sp. GAS27A TaxID=3156270 RepID=UPI0038327BB2